MENEPLSRDEARLWHAWKLAGEYVMARVTRDITDGTGLTGAEFGVLSRLAGPGHGELRQNELADSMGWDKSRLSHQLTRMEARRLIKRTPADGKGVVVVITAAGRKSLTAARPVHAQSVRKHLLDMVSGARGKVLLEICEQLADLEGDE